MRVGTSRVTAVGTRGVVFAAARGSLQSPSIDLYFTDGQNAAQKLSQFPSSPLQLLRLTSTVGSRAIYEFASLSSQSIVQYEFWGTDGTSAGTQQLFRTTNWRERTTAVAAGLAYIDVGGAIYSSDGTRGGTRLARRLRRIVQAAQDGIVLENTGGGRSFLDASGAERALSLPSGEIEPRGQTAAGEALLASEAGLFAVRASGMRKVADLPGSPTASSFPGLMMRVGDSLVVRAQLGRLDDERRVYAIDPRNSAVSATAIESEGSAAPFVLFRGHLYGSVEIPSAGTELAAYDPTSLQRMTLFDVRKGSASSNPESIVATSKRLFFVRENGVERQLYSLGSVLGPVDTLPVKGRSLSVSRWGEKVLVSAASATQQELWISEGTAATTRRLMTGSRLLVGARRARDVLVLRQGATTADVLALDESARTTLLANGISARSRLHSVVLDGDYIFGTYDGLYASDGTRAGTTRLRTDRISGLVTVGLDRYAYLTGATTLTAANRLTITDGTTRGTRSVGESGIGELLSLGSRWLSYVVGSRQRATTAFVDTRRPTYAVTRFAVDRRTWPTVEVPVIGGSVFFAGESAFFGREPFRVDGLGAMAVEAGTACGRGTRAMRLAGNAPRLGQTARLQVEQAPQLPALLLGLGEYNYEGLAGPDACRIHLDVTKPVIFLPLTPRQGAFSVSLPIPNDPALRGLEIAAQVFGAGTQGFESSSALLLQLGD